MELYQNYQKIFLFSLVIALLSLFARGWEYIYVALYILSSANLIFVRRAPVEINLSHSTQSHFALNSRLNILNLVIAGYLPLSILIYTFAPDHLKLITIVGNWGALTVFLKYFAAKVILRVHTQLLINYLQSVLPDVASDLIQHTVYKQVYNPNAQIEETDQQDYERVLSSLQKYLATNHE